MVMNNIFYKKSNLEIDNIDIVSYVIVFLSAFCLFLGFNTLFKVMSVVLSCVFAYQIYLKNKGDGKTYLKDIVIYYNNELYIVLVNIKKILLIEGSFLIILYFLNLELIGWYMIALLITFYETNEYIKRKRLNEFINNFDIEKSLSNSKYSIYRIDRVLKINDYYRINYGNYEREYYILDEYNGIINFLNNMNVGGYNEEKENINN